MDLDLLNARSIDGLGWIGRRIDINLDVPNIPGEIALEMSSGADYLYDYYPFIVTFSIDGRPEFHAEITGPHQAHHVRFPVAPALRRLLLSIRSEQGARPADRPGGGADERELAVHLASISWRAGGSCARRAPALMPISDSDMGPIAQKTCRPVFVIGCYRSGTSIATWAIGQHPNIAPMEETNWLPMLYMASIAAYRMSAGRGLSSAASVYELSQSAFLAWQGNAISALHEQSIRYFASQLDLQRHSNKAPKFNERFQVHRSRFARKARWIDGTPENTGIAIGLSRMFSDARFIFMLRHPRLVISSLMRFDNIGGKRYTFESAAKLWERMTCDGYEASCRLGPTRVLLTLHERLISDQAALVDDWFAFLDEPRFPIAAETLRHVINSSGKTEELEVSGDQAEILARLERIYEGVATSCSMGELPWSVDAGGYEERENDVVHRLVGCMS